MKVRNARFGKSVQKLIIKIVIFVNMVDCNNARLLVL